MKWQIENANLYQNKSGHGLVFSNGSIDHVLTKKEQPESNLSINLHGLPVFPGLVNSHDSLIATYVPLDKPENPYRNWLSFDNELKASQIFEERLSIDIEDLYSLGGYKNIINGATFVVDHIPHFVRKPYLNSNIAQLLPDYGISHSVCSYNLNWGDGYRREHDYAVQNNLPYIVHIAEGLDLESRESLSHLNDMGALTDHTVLVHGVSLSHSDLELIAKKSAHLVWCPVSNMRLYSKTLDIRLAMQLGINVCLGTDSAMTGSLGLLHELNYAIQFYQQTYSEDLDPDELLKMVIENPVKAFRLDNTGSLDVGNIADCIVLNNRNIPNPAQALTHSDLEDIFLVIRNGQPVYADESLNILFNELDLEYSNITINQTKKVIHQGFEHTMKTIRDTTSSDREFPFFPLG